MSAGDRFDPAALFGCQVVDGAGHGIGRVSALIHRADGCDVLVERRHWLRHVVVRVDLDDLVAEAPARYRVLRATRSSNGPRDGWVA